MPGTWSHLASRFVETAGARPLDTDEKRWVEARLEADEGSAYWEQSVADQRHGYEAAHHVAAHGGSRQMERAALLHDVAKRHARLGILGRSMASVAIRLRLPLRGRARLYRDHGPLAAAELGHAGAEELVVMYARHHHGNRPASISPDVWRLLQAADGAHPRR